MSRIVSKALSVAHLAASGHPGAALDAVRDRLYKDTAAFGLRRDLAAPFTAPAAKIPIEVRPLRATDDLGFLRLESGPPEETLTRLGQLRLVKMALPTCYVAVAGNGEICYMQWLIAARANPQLRASFGPLFPVLAHDEALLEGAFTVPAYRGMGIMASAMAQIAACGAEFGARWAITFVGSDNLPSLKGCERAGFARYVVRRESWRLLKRSIHFDPLEERPPLARAV